MHFVPSNHPHHSHHVLYEAPLAPPAPPADGYGEIAYDLTVGGSSGDLDGISMGSHTWSERMVGNWWQLSVVGWCILILALYDVLANFYYLDGSGDIIGSPPITEMSCSSILYGLLIGRLFVSPQKSEQSC